MSFNFSALSVDSSEFTLGAVFFLDISNKKMYNMNRVGENVTSIEEYDVASINTSTYAVSGLSLVGTMHYSFDSNGKQFRKKYVSADGAEQKYVFEYQDEQNVAVQLPTGVVSHAKSDHLGRKVFDELQLGKGLMNRKFTYHEGEITATHEANDKKVSDAQTTLVKQIEFADGRTIQYEYDAEERITKVIDSVDGTFEYTYDALGQLLTEKKNNVTVNTMTYDKYGNIATKNGKTYAYDSTWKDKLLSTGDGSIGNYDLNGNPQSYLGNTLVWEKGRQLKSFGSSSYKYNNDGIRIKKTTSSEVHEYILDGTNIVKEIVTDICNCHKYTNEYLYDLDGTVCGLKYNGTAYYFYKNLQGDIIAITDDTGVTVARYTYDAWGSCVSAETHTNLTNGVDIATINPFRYRSYYYDTETGFYYLHSRYYDPAVGRFINADDVRILATNATIGSFMLYSYCSNSPIMDSDESGYSPIQMAFALIGAIAGVFLGDYVARSLGYFPNKGSFWNRSTYWVIRAGVIIGGAVIGWFAASVLTAILKGFIFSNTKLIASTPLWVYRFLGIATGAGSVVLGKYPLYVQLAEKLGSSIFQIATSVWKSMSASAQWAANKAFLDKIIESGQKITLQTNAYSSKVTGWFEREIQYLLEHGYKIIEGGWAMGPK